MQRLPLRTGAAVIIDRPKAPPVCHGERMHYSEATLCFLCAKPCGHVLSLQAYLAERSNYHLEDLGYQAKVEAVRAYLKGEPMPDWARETLAIESIRILKKAEPATHEGFRSLCVICKAAGYARPASHLGDCGDFEEPQPISREASSNAFWPRPAVADAAEELRAGMVDSVRYAADVAGLNPTCCNPGITLWICRRCNAQVTHTAICHERRIHGSGCRHQSPGVGLPCGFCADLAQTRDQTAALERAPQADLYADQLRYAAMAANAVVRAALDPNPLARVEPPDLDQRIAYATDDGKRWEQAEADAHEANARDWAKLRPTKGEPNG